MILTKEITQEEYEKAKAKGVYSIIDDEARLGFGLNKSEIYEKNGHYYLQYEPKQYSKGV